MKIWGDWDTDGGASLAKLIKDQPDITKAKASIFKRMTKGIDVFTYAMLRHYFKGKYKRGNKFSFYSYVTDCLQDEFAESVGISPPMWGLVVFYVAANDADGFMHLFVTFLGLAMTLAIQFKLTAIAKTVGDAAYSKIDTSGDGELDADEIKALYADIDTTGAKLVIYETLLKDDQFWFSKPDWMTQGIRILMFQNGLTLASSLFYLTSGGGIHSCYYEMHATYIVPKLLFAMFQLFQIAFQVLPLMTLIKQMGSQYNFRIFGASGAQVKGFLAKKKHGHGHGHGGHDEGHGGGGKNDNKVHPEPVGH